MSMFSQFASFLTGGLSIPTLLLTITLRVLSPSAGQNEHRASAMPLQSPSRSPLSPLSLTFPLQSFEPKICAPFCVTVWVTTPTPGPPPAYPPP